eukprot:TRINITY_DN4715_c0_g1_i5.p1 TRINITY_DN4715_c0_g1~~TRINITY_DN4715_c0_g1_i5.p1  ORF type:complete len:197 (+),score=31.68 TRINITY_DN4715_c0_g1_i5:489-1079(+)
MVSGSYDNTLRFWDLRATACRALLKGSGPSFVAFEPQGDAICVLTGNQPSGIRLYNLKCLEKGSFANFSVPDNIHNYAGVTFSQDGKFLLITTDGPPVYLLDAFTGQLLQTIHVTNNHQTPIAGTFMMDSKFAVIGSENGNLHLWEIETETGPSEVAIWKGHTNPVTSILCNPSYKMIASSCVNTVFWLPELGDAK